MALTTTPIELSATPGIVDNSDATAITIDSSEQVTLSGNLIVQGDATINGNLTFGDDPSDTISIGANITGSLKPDTTNTYDLGTPSLQWNTGYLNDLQSTSATIGTLTVSTTATIPYDNTVSGMAANNVQSAISELNSLIGGGNVGSQASFDVFEFTASASQTTFDVTTFLTGGDVTSSQIITGVEYEITIVGDTDFTTIGAASNNVGIRFTATGSTTGTGIVRKVATYIPGYIQVYLNGLLLSETDYTATDGENVVLAESTDLNDILAVKKVDSFGTAEILRVLSIDSSASTDSLIIDENDNLVLGAEIHGPATLVIDPSAIGDNTGLVLIKGNLQVDGTQTTINSTVVEVDDLNLTVASGAADSAAANTGGLDIDGAGVQFRWDHANNRMNLNKNLDVTGTLEFDGGITSADLNFGDNNKAVFGASSDLQIYHSTNSYIQDSGAGSLFLLTQGAEISLLGNTSAEYMGRFIQDGAVELYHNGNQKLATTATGIDVTGTVTADGLTVQTSADPALITLRHTGNTSGLIIKNFSGGESQLVNVDNGPMVFKTNDTEAMRIDSSGNVGIASDPSDWASSYKVLQISSASAMFNTSNETLIASNAYIDSGFAWRYRNSNTAARYTQNGPGHAWYIAPSGTAGNVVGWTQAMTLDSSGNVGIGPTTVESTLHLQAASAGGRGATLTLDNNGTSTVGNEVQIAFLTDAGASVAGIANARIKVINTDAGNGSADLTFTTWNGSSENEAMRIDSSGNVGIDATPSAWGSIFKSLDIRGSSVSSTAAGALVQSGNAYFNGTNWIYKNDGPATRVELNASTSGSVWYTSASGTAGNTITFTPSMTLDASANLDVVGRVKTQSDLNVYGGNSGSAANRVALCMEGAGASRILVNGPDVGTNGSFKIDLTNSTGTIGHTLTYDASGNLLVGTTTVNGTGITLGAGDYGYFSRSTGVANDASLYANRGTSDGSLIELRKADVAVGTIGTNSGFPYFAAPANFSIMLETTSVIPRSNTGAFNENNTVDLGSSDARFKDLFIGNDIGHLDAADNARLLYDKSANLLGNAGTNGTFATLSKSSGSFKIDHPLPEKTETHYLVHSFVESPQANNIYRGKVDLVDGLAAVNIDDAAGMTEGTYVLLNTNTQCFTSNESGWTAVKGSVSGNILTITAQDNTCTDTISWMVIGERHDQHMLDTEWTDENGKVIVEPLKES